jgi:hypothetical protein
MLTFQQAGDLCRAAVFHEESRAHECENYGTGLHHVLPAAASNEIYRFPV